MPERVSPDTVVVDVAPRIGRETFCRVLREAGSPAAGECEACYRAIAEYGVDPAFALAVFRHESRYGTVGIVAQYELRNPGATRTSRTGVGEPVAIPGRGQFWRYPSWQEGFRDMAVRLTDPTFVYRREGRRTIRAIVERWAPASDGNVPESYVAAVVRAMNEWIGEEQAMQQVPAVLTTVPGVPLRVSLVPQGNRNRPAYPLVPRWITVHETANEHAGANAEMHRRFVHAGGGPEGVSFHFVVDDREAIQLLPLNENGWHAGDGANGTGNRQSIGIELCVNSDGDWERTQRHGALLVAHLCRTLAIPLERVVPHQHWSGKNCPRRILQVGFDAFRRRVAELLQSDGGAVVRQVGPHGKHIGHGFLAFWEALERIDPTLPLRALGWPLTEEFSLESGGTAPVYQLFERGVLKYDRAAQPPWDVHVCLSDEAVQVRAAARQRGLIP